jgi:uncharacterized OB-fold protein
MGFEKIKFNNTGVDSLEGACRYSPFSTHRQKLVVCKCPRCGRTHKSNLFWTGRGTPRIFCLDCKERTGNVGNIEEYYVMF